MINEIEWEWPRAQGKPYKIFLNLRLGTLEVLNNQGETIIRKTDLNKRQIMFIYQNLNQRLKHPKSSAIQRTDQLFDPMIN